MTITSLDLLRLARMYGVQADYVDVWGARRQILPEVLTSVLHSLGAPESFESSPGDAARERRLELWHRALPPASAVRCGERPRLRLRLRSGELRGALACRIDLETGETREWKVAPDRLPAREARNIEGESFRVHVLDVPEVPPGYHVLIADTGVREARCHLVCAPRRAWRDPRVEASWGLFHPLYGLRSATDWGAGDLTDLRRASEWVASLGGQTLATLPLLSAWLEPPFSPTPYAPASRLFWNELYLDLGRAPELEQSAAARELLAASGAEIRELRGLPLVDVERVLDLKHKVLDVLAAAFFRGARSRSAAFRQFLVDRPQVADYARFRAAVGRLGPDWRRWPEPARSGTLRDTDADPLVVRRHVYAQWLAADQMRTAAAPGAAGLQLDFPVGSHPDGYDVWRERAQFAPRAAVGAPPDEFFRFGQDWGFPPPSPSRMREDGFRFMRRALGTQMEVSSSLRIDHVMGLWRLYWVPEGFPATAGAYVRYPADELIAVFCLESERHRCELVGEDLGTVPAAARRGLHQHRFRRTWVPTFGANGADIPVATPPVGSVAMLETHDMYPFEAFLTGEDVRDRIALGLLAEAEAGALLARRRRIVEELVAWVADSGARSAAALFRELLLLLGRSEAGIVLANLDDLLGETRAQNVPGTARERPNWRLRAPRTLEEILTDSEIRKTLTELNASREASRLGRSDRGNTAPDPT